MSLQDMDYKQWVEAIKPYANNSQFEFTFLPNELKSRSCLWKASVHGHIRKINRKAGPKTAIWRIVK